MLCILKQGTLLASTSTKYRSHYGMFPSHIHNSFWATQQVFLGSNLIQLEFKLEKMQEKLETVFVSKIVLVIENNFWNSGWRLRICKTFEITVAINLNLERSVQFLRQNAFLTFSWRFLRSNTWKNNWDFKKRRKSSEMKFLLNVQAHKTYIT